MYVAYEGLGAGSFRGGLDAGTHPPGGADAGAGDAGCSTVDELVRRATELGARCYDLAPGVMARVADTVTPQPVMAVFPMLDVPAVPVGARLVVVMVDVRDPGNAGTVLRTADAAGADAVVCCGGTVDPYNPKTVRSSAGSLFHVPLVLGEDAVTVLDELGSGTGGSGSDASDAGDGSGTSGPRLRRLGAVVRGGEDYAAVDWTVPTALVLGNEATGLPPTVPLDGRVAIPMAGRAESLNVGMACAVLCFEALRQRRSTMPR